MRKWLGRVVGSDQYRIVQHLGSGGMGHVFLAESPRTAARVAVKVLTKHASWEHQRLFANESELLFQQRHDNIVRALEAGSLNCSPYLLMEYVPGIDLAEWLDYDEPRPPRRVLYILSQVASAIEHLHGQGIVHRDVKPANIILDERNDTAKLIDFGIAVREGTAGDDDNRHMVGTPAYMAPELVAGGRCTRASDVYSLAALALELLTGAPPHGRAPVVSILDALLHGSPTLPSARGLVAPGLDSFFKRALCRDPAKRFRTAWDLVSTLADVLPHSCVPAHRRRTGAVLQRDTVVARTPSFAATGLGATAWVEHRSARC